MGFKNKLGGLVYHEIKIVRGGGGGLHKNIKDIYIYESKRLKINNEPESKNLLVYCKLTNLTVYHN
jgi:hypothetical protein